ncbi:MAG TPA: MFS transporter [Gemmatimonadaceae bacterium]|nr:MFS transporter [Gemmatimonadaceae bacterium]
MSDIGDNLSAAEPTRQRTRQTANAANAANAAPPPPGGARGGLLARLGLDRPELRAWAMYDWAISGMQAVILASVFQIYFASVAAHGLPGSRATQAWSTINTVGAVLVAVLAPILGALADYAAAKKKLTAVCMLVGVLGTAGMWFIQQGDLALAMVLFLLSLVGSTASLTFYESLLPHIAREEEIDRVSTGGYALGYLGGGLLLALNLAWIQKPEWFGLPSGPNLTPAQATLPARLSFVSVAVWWLVFSIPLFRKVREPARRLEADETTGASAVRVALTRLGETVRSLRGFKHAFLMLLAFMIYNDGIQTIIKTAAAYGTELGIPQGALIGSILLVQFVGVPFAFLFGMLAGRIGAKRSIFLGLVVYTLISIVGFFMRTATHFLLLALLVGMVQGGTQALSRSLFASMVPPHKSGEFFGFYSVFEKFANIFGPLVFSLTIAGTGSSRYAILSVIAFFAIGAVLLAKVDVAEGQRVARLAEAGTHGAPAAGAASG